MPISRFCRVGHRRVRHPGAGPPTLKPVARCARMDEEPATSPRDIPHEGYLPLALAAWARTSPRAVFVAGDDAMLQGLAATLPAFLTDRVIRILPAWDNAPYDVSRPSRSATGTRVATLGWLAEHPADPVLILTTPESITQRVPPAGRFVERAIRLQPGEPLDTERLKATLAAFGYDAVERVEAAGEATIRAGAVDIWSAGQPSPVRLDLEDGHIEGIRRFDPDSQLTVSDVRSVQLLPASEAFTVPGDDEAPSGRVAERFLPDGPLWTLFDLLPDAALAMLDGAEARAADWLTLVRDSYRVAVASVREGRRCRPTGFTSRRMNLRRR
jgi:transcription-repair coupling factor (superfamily II helicase)